MDNKNERLWNIAVPAVLVLMFLTWNYVIVGAVNWLIVVPFVLAYLLYLATLCRRMPPAESLLLLYLLTLAWLLLHAAEDMTAAAHPADPATRLGLAFHLVVDAMFVLGAVGIVTRRPWLGFFVCYLAVRTLVNGFGHPLLHLVEGEGWYSTGLVTGTLSLVFGIPLLIRICDRGSDPASEA